MTNENSSFDSYNNWYSTSYESTTHQVLVELRNGLEASSDYNLPSDSSKLDEYANNTLTVGNKDAFQIISNELCDKIKKADQTVNDYLSLAEERKKEILDCMAQDSKARDAAARAYCWVINNEKSNYVKKVEVKDLRGVVVGYKEVYDEDAHIKAAKAKREEVWVDKRCYLWG